MSHMDYFLINLIINNLNKISSGYIYLDLFISVIGMFSATIILNEKFKRKSINYFYNLFSNNNKVTSLTFPSCDKTVSSKYKALMYFIREKNDPSVRALIETELTKYNSRKDEDEVQSSVYRVCQNNIFCVDKEKKIDGRVFISNKEKLDFGGKVITEELFNLEISSRDLSSKQLIDWVDEKEKEYKNYLKIKMLEGQSLIEVSWNPYEDDIECLYTKWDSNVNFSNRFFTAKEEIVEKIKFFLENEQWYKSKGIPYTLGILLWGEPGCGKTGFIKALMNLTGRHGIDVKLCDKFNFSKLREIIFDEQISDELIIPQNKRLFIFEDIDAMGDIVKDRDLQKNSSENELEDKIQKIIVKKTKRRKKKRGLDDSDSFYEDPQNNNLSYFLNILDGLNECSGRIIIMTTNKPEFLDNALIRPGRIDYKIHMKKATIDDISNILNYYWETKNIFEIPLEWEQKVSHAELINWCRISDSISDTIFKIKKHFETINERLLNDSPSMKIFESNYILPCPSPINLQ